MMEEKIITCPECGGELSYYGGCECGLTYLDAMGIEANENDCKW